MQLDANNSFVHNSANKQALRNFTLKKFPSGQTNVFNFICLDRQIGKGAYGDVYLGYQNEPLSYDQKPDFAVKVINK